MANDPLNVALGSAATLRAAVNRLLNFAREYEVPSKDAIADCERALDSAIGATMLEALDKLMKDNEEFAVLVAQMVTAMTRKPTGDLATHKAVVGISSMREQILRLSIDYDRLEDSTSADRVLLQKMTDFLSVSSRCSCVSDLDTVQCMRCKLLAERRAILVRDIGDSPLDKDKMPADIATRVFDVLVEEGGAPEHGREQFLFHYTRSDHPPVEYRFMGALGFGGKFWRANQHWYITTYSEDETRERRAFIEQADKRLAVLRAELEAVHVKDHEDRARSGHHP